MNGKNGVRVRRHATEAHGIGRGVAADRNRKVSDETALGNLNRLVSVTLNLAKAKMKNISNLSYADD